MTATDPKIDFTQIDFPSDKLTIKMIRRACSDAADVDRTNPNSRGDRPYVRSSLDILLGVCLIDPERMVAERAFRLALGQSVSDDDNLANKDELVEPVTAAYLKFGLAQGEHEAKAMIRRVETQAEAQARKHGSRSP